MGPDTSGPEPWDHSVSVARRVSPAMRRFDPMSRFEFLKKSATWTAASVGNAWLIPSGRLMSSEWTSTSPSIVVGGPGGWPLELTIASNRASVSAADAPAWAAMPLACSDSNLNPLLASLGRNDAGVMLAVALM